jgi:DNA polymerase-3 subunit alpha
MLTLDNIPLDEPKVYELLAKAVTKGVFQLESPLGRSFLKKVKPKNIEEIADVISIIRPGSLDYIFDDKNATQHYVDRKNGTETFDCYHPVLEEILKPTFSIIVYQEQSMEICKLIAGFNLKEADEVRKAAGKKSPELMAKVKIKFMEGVKRVGIVNEVVAENIFQNIEASQRYAFCRAHAIAYALLSYYTSYIKALYPEHFFLSWLSKSHLKIDPQQELDELVTDARLGGIDIRPPDFRVLNTSFEAREKTIYFGYESIRSFGESNLVKLLDGASTVEAQLGKSRDEWSWMEILLFYSDQIVKSNMEALIGCGAFDYLKIPRKRMYYEYDVYQKLTVKEQEWCKNNYTDKTLIELFTALSRPKKEGGGAANKNRIAKILDLILTLERPPVSLEDTGAEKTEWEQKYLGVAVTTTYVEDYDDIETNCTCYMFANGVESRTRVVMGVELVKVREHTIKNGKQIGSKMMFLTAQDETGTINNITVFPDTIEKYGHLLKDRSVVYLIGNRDSGYGSLNVLEVYKMQNKHNLYNESDSSEFLT